MVEAIAMTTMYDPTSAHHRMLLAQHILQVILNAGFIEESVAVKGTRERVFYRAVDGHPGVRIQVYTTVEGNGTHATVRSVGDDSIKVCAVYRSKEGKDRGIVSTTRIHRTGTIESIRDRLLTRMREVYRRAAHPNTCLRCGAPTFRSKKGNNVCADICFKQG